MYCVGGSLKNLCHFEMGGGGGVWQMLTSSGGGGSLNADSLGGGGKICQNLADVICERSLKVITIWTRVELKWTQTSLGRTNRIHFGLSPAQRRGHATQIKNIIRMIQLFQFHRSKNII